MRDIEYLLKRADFSGALIYRYRSGVLRVQVREAFCAVTKEGGRDTQCCVRDELYHALRGGLFDLVYWCDWTDKAPSTMLQHRLDALLSRIMTMGAEPLALFVPVDSSLLSHPLWPQVETAAGLVLEEELVTDRSLLPALRLFQETSDLANGVDWLAHLDFRRSFASFRRGEKRTLLELRHAFDERIAACTDPDTQTFLPEVYRELHPEESRNAIKSASRALHALITTSRVWEGITLVQVLDERRNQRGWTVRAVVTELYRVTGHILIQFEIMQRLDMINMRVKAILWAALLLSWDGRFQTAVLVDGAAYRRQADGFVGAIDRLVRDFVARASLEAGADPMAGVWAELDLALTCAGEHPAGLLGPARSRIVRALDQALRHSDAVVPWLARLRERICRALTEAQTAEMRREQLRID